MDTGIVHPWQSGPTEILTYALNHFHNSTDPDRRIAFLLLDVGVETVLKTYLQLPQEIIKTNLSFYKRQQASEGNFHQVLEGVKEADIQREAGQESRLQGINLPHIEFYHDIRNKLYHQGNGITVSVEKVAEYAEIAALLLERLLSVDLQDLLRLPEKEELRQQALKSLREDIENKKVILQRRIDILNSKLEFAIEKIETTFLLPRFKREYSEWVERVYAQNEDKAKSIPDVLKKFIEKRKIAIEKFDVSIDYNDFLFKIAHNIIEFSSESYGPEGMYAFARFYVKGEYPPPLLYEGETEEDNLKYVIHSGDELIAIINEMIETTNKWDSLS